MIRSPSSYGILTNLEAWSSLQCQLTELWQQILFDFIGRSSAELLHWYPAFAKTRRSETLGLVILSLPE